MGTISILANTVRPSVDCRSDDTTFGVGIFSWQDPVHSWKAGLGEAMTVKNLLKVWPPRFQTFPRPQSLVCFWAVQNLARVSNEVSNDDLGTHVAAEAAAKSTTFVLWYGAIINQGPSRGLHGNGGVLCYHHKKVQRGCYRLPKILNLPYSSRPI